jgi:putative ABC transport system permease protein
MSDEIRHHLELRVERNVSAGMPPDEALADARRSFGGIEQIKERCRDVSRWSWMEQMGKDVSFSARLLWRSPAFAVTMIGTLVLGIGVATAVFDLCADAVLFPLPYPRADELYMIGFKDKRSASNPWSYAKQMRLYREQTNVFSEFATESVDASNVVVGGDPRVEPVARLSADSFGTLGIRPAMGRVFLPEEYFAGADNVVIVTDSFWKQRLGSRPDVLGQKIRIDQQECTVVGVLKVLQPFPAEFNYGRILRPMLPVNNDPTDVWGGGLAAIGRLKPGVTPDAACSAMAAVKRPPMPSWASKFFAEQQPILVQLRTLNRPDIEWVMLGAAAILFLMSCVNSVNLMLVRILGRRREFSIRLAVGATRRQIGQLLAIETAGICTAAALFTAFLAHFTFPAAIVAVSGHFDDRYASYASGASLACIVGLSALSGILILGFAVAGFSRTQMNPGLKEGGSAVGESKGLGRVKFCLIGLQTALAVVMLVGTGLMIRTFEKLHHVNLGFDPEGKVKVRVVFPHGREPKPAERLQLFDRMDQALSLLPGVKAVSSGQDSLFMGFFAGTAQLKMADGSFLPIAGNFVSSTYQQTAGLRMKRGRWLSGKHGAIEAVVNEALAKRRFGTIDAVGKTFQIEVAGDTMFTVVGVVEDVRETARSTAGMRIYSPDWVYPPNIDTMVMRLDRNPPDGFDDLVRRAIYKVDPDIVTTNVDSIDQLVTQSMSQELYAFKILRGLTAIGFGLAIIGVFSVIAYTVDSRMREFGVRKAIGADASSLKALVLKRGLAPTGLGVILGSVMGLLLTQFMRSMLFETSPYDPAVFLLVDAVLMAAAAAACWIPATRASKADVASLLRTD